MGTKKKMSKQKRISLFSGSEEGYNWEVQIHIGATGYIGEAGFVTIDAYKVRTRSKDRKWVKRNLGSLRGVYEIHHDWTDAGRMYLLTKQEHLDADAGLRGNHGEKKLEVNKKYEYSSFCNSQR